MCDVEIYACVLELLCGDGRIIGNEVCDDGGICIGSTRSIYNGRECFDLDPTENHQWGVQRCIATGGTCSPQEGDGCSADCSQLCLTTGETCFTDADCMEPDSLSCARCDDTGKCVTTSIASSAAASSVSSETCSADTTTYQAENATLSGPTVATANAGYTGAGYADYTSAPSGEYIEWTVTSPATSTATLEFRHALASGSRPLELKVNGSVVEASLSFPSTGSWTTWNTVTKSVTLNSGPNTIRLTSIGTSGSNIDKLDVTTTCP